MYDITVVIPTMHPEKAEKAASVMVQTAASSLQVQIVVNPTGQGLCQVFNNSIQNIEAPLVVFVHDDVVMKSSNWDISLISAFEDPLFGMLGVVGSTVLDRTGFWANADPGFLRGQISQWCSEGLRHHRYDARTSGVSPVAAVDGCFFAVRASLFSDGLRFDASRFSGFHFYEVDLAAQIQLEYGQAVGVVADFWIEHGSEGRFDESWHHFRSVFMKKYLENLPLYVDHRLHPDNFKQREQEFERILKEKNGLQP